MKTSFFLTPELKEKAVNLAFRDPDGTLHPWANQIKIIEQDYTKGMQKNSAQLSVLAGSDLDLDQFVLFLAEWGCTPL